jgi:alpha-ketoglutarate-dependent taurine dioxygenase
MPVPVRKCDAALGGEIVFDLSQPIDDRTFGEIERLFHDNIIVFFRDQRLTNEQPIVPRSLPSFRRGTARYVRTPPTSTNAFARGSSAL